jgi:hypothetical protein
MSAILKYVNGPLGPVLFEMSTAIQHDTFKVLNPTSAGAVIVDAEKGVVKAYGNSLSLGLASVEGDTEAIAALLGIKGKQ